MTEAEWLAEDHPGPLLRHLRRDWRQELFEIGRWFRVRRQNGKERRFRLFACACFRNAWHRLADDRERRAVEVAEQYADSLASWRELVGVTRRYGDAGFVALKLAGDAASHSAFQATKLLIPNYRDEQARRVVQAKHCDLLRDVFGNPFRPVAFDPAWRTPTVVAVARGIYDERAFDRLPILADTLLDAGCEHPDVLAHCRGDGPHVRGCWVVDLVLGKD